MGGATAYLNGDGIKAISAQLGLGFGLSLAKLKVDQRELGHMKPVNQVKPFDVTFHIRAAYEREIIDMIEAGIIVPCEVPTNWNTKAFPVIKGDGVSIRLVGDFRGLNSVLKKLL